MEPEPFGLVLASITIEMMTKSAIMLPMVRRKDIRPSSGMHKCIAADRVVILAGPALY